MTYPPAVNRGTTDSWDGSSWTTLNSLNTARRRLAGAGSQTLAVAFGGGDAPPQTGATETWDGTSWATNPNSMSTARSQLGGKGTYLAALAFGGSTPSLSTATEEWNGAGTLQTVTIDTDQYLTFII